MGRMIIMGITAVIAEKSAVIAMRLKGICVLVLLFVLFSIIAFACPFPHNAGFWVAYVFGIVSILFQAYFFNKSFKAGETVRSKIYGFPIARIGVLYLVIQIILSIAEMAFASAIEAWVFGVVDVIVFSLAVLGGIGTEIARDEVVRQDAALTSDVKSMQEMKLQVKSINGLCKIQELQDPLNELVSCIEFSDPKSNAATEPIELAMQEKLNCLRHAVSAEDAKESADLIMQLRAIVAERNAICLASK